MNSGFKYFTLSYAFFRLGFDLMGLFGAISFYVIFDHSLAHAFGIYALIYLLTTILILPVLKLSEKLGTRNAIIIATFLFALSFFPLSQLPTKRVEFIALWVIISSLARALYWVPMHYYMSNLTEEKKRGSQIGLLYAIVILFSIVAPFIGGYTTEYFGITGLAIAMGIFYLISLIPLFKIPNYRFQFTGNFLRIIFSRDILKIVKVIGVNELQAKETVWSLFVFLLLGSSFIYFGNVATIVALISVIASLVIGRFLDHNNRLRVLKYDSLINSCLWLIRSVIYTVGGIIFVDSSFKINMQVRNQAVDTISYDLLAKKNQEELLDEKIVARELWVNLLIALNFTLSLLLVSFFGFQFVFVFAALSSLLFWLI